MFRVHEIEEGIFHARGRRPQILHLLKTEANPAPPKKEQKKTKKSKIQKFTNRVQTNEKQTKKEFKRNCDLSNEIHRKQANTNRNNKRTNKQPFVLFFVCSGKASRHCRSLMKASGEEKGKDRKEKKKNKKREKKGEVRKKLGEGKRWLRPL
jgi:hypothetical protein